MKKRKDGRYQEQITITVDGKKKQKYFYGRTQKEVLEKLRSYKESSASGPTFAAVAQKWWPQHEATLTYNSIKPYRPAVARAVDRFGDMLIREISPFDVHSFIMDFADSGAAQKTVKTQLMVINLLCKWAVARGIISSNPARDISAPKGLPHKSREIASDLDIQRIKDSTDCTFGLFAYWILYTGLRRGELMGLRWSDVDTRSRKISVARSVYQDNNIPRIKEPKTEAGRRTVPLMDRLAEKITPGKGYVFPGSGENPMSESQFKSLWRRYKIESGVSCSPHQIRHAYATLLYESGVDIKAAQDILGHAQASTTQDIYTHIRQAQREKVDAAILDADFK